jgi:Septum formation
MRLALPIRTLGRAVATVAAAATLLAVSTGPVSAGTTDGPDYQQPTVGECRDLDLTQAMKKSNGTAPIDCSNPHTTRVVAVGHLPAALDWDSPNRKLSRAVGKVCEPAAAEALGGSAALRNRSAYGWFWFAPTKAQRAHGARWIRCDLALFGGARLLRLPTDDVPALEGAPLPDSVARCLTAKTFAFTTCARKHTFRATGTFRMRQDTYPTLRQFEAAVLKRCPARVESASWRWGVRGKYAWELGDHTVVCYTKTRS